MDNNNDLVAGLVAKNPAALEAFYHQYRSPILAVARRMVHDEWDAEEVLQDVIWTVHRKAHTFRGDTDLWRWVYRVTQNAARMLLRKRKRVPIPCDDQDMEAMINTSMENQPTLHPERITLQRLALERMDKELRSFDPVNQQLFRAMEMRGEAKEEVARDLGLSIPAVKARLHRIRKALRSSAEDLVPAA
jgi:RNA polymerase sigma-70 factor (ECF subfamily)